MPRSYTKNIALFDGTSGDSTTTTSAWQMVADFDVLSVSWNTDTGTASRLTLEGSNDLGTTSAIANSSTLTGITVQGLYTVDPGVRFIRGIRNSNESLSIVRLNLQA